MVAFIKDGSNYVQAFSVQKFKAQKLGYAILDELIQRNQNPAISRRERTANTTPNTTYISSGHRGLN